MRSRTRWARTPRARVCRILLVAASFAMSAVVGSPCWGGVPEPPPSQWQLYQNDPEPFCGSTRIMFAVPQAAHLQLTVKNSDATQVVRQLVNMDGMAGLYTVIWDGLDGDGNPVAPGAYPYVLRATDIATQVLLFEGTKTAHMDCPVATDPRPWGVVKSLYR